VMGPGWLSGVSSIRAILSLQRLFRAQRAQQICLTIANG
jgi:hypothetical protein